MVSLIFRELNREISGILNMTYNIRTYNVDEYDIKYN